MENLFFEGLATGRCSYNSGVCAGKKGQGGPWWSLCSRDSLEASVHVPSEAQVSHCKTSLNVHTRLGAARQEGVARDGGSTCACLKVACLMPFRLHADTTVVISSRESDPGLSTLFSTR